MHAMNKFQTWLDSNPGMATRIRKKLEIGAATVSNVKHERRPLPDAWIPLVVDFSKKFLKSEELLNWRHQVKDRLKTNN